MHSVLNLLRLITLATQQTPAKLCSLQDPLGKTQLVFQGLDAVPPAVVLSSAPELATDKRVQFGLRRLKPVVLD